MQYKEFRNEINQALKKQDKLRLSILRQVLNEVDGDVKADPSKHAAGESDVNTALKRTLKQTKETLAASEKAASNQQRTDDLARQVSILESYLPEQLEGDALEQRVRELIPILGIENKNGLGKLMGVLSSETDGNFDKAAAASIAKSILP